MEERVRWYARVPRLGGSFPGLSGIDRGVRLRCVMGVFGFDDVAAVIWTTAQQRAEVREQQCMQAQ